MSIVFVAQKIRILEYMYIFPPPSEQQQSGCGCTPCSRRFRLSDTLDTPAGHNSRPQSSSRVITALSQPGLRHPEDRDEGARTYLSTELVDRAGARIEVAARDEDWRLMSVIVARHLQVVIKVGRVDDLVERASDVARNGECLPCTERLESIKEVKRQRTSPGDTAVGSTTRSPKLPASGQS